VEDATRGRGSEEDAQTKASGMRCKLRGGDRSRAGATKCVPHER